MMNNRLNEDADLFLKYNYPETKDMCKQFLTLVTSILILSLTFSDKVINFDEASDLSKWLLISAWVILLLAIIFCGIGLTLITLAAGDALYRKYNYLLIASKSYKIIIAAGVSFILGLILLIATVVVSVTTSKNSLNSKDSTETGLLVDPTKTYKF